MFLTARSVLLALLIPLAGPHAFSAVILTNSYIVTAVGINTDTDSSPSDPATAISILGNNPNNNLGTAEAEAESLTVTNPNADPDSFQVSGADFALASVARLSSGSNANVNGLATATHTITFELGINEVGLASFDLEFTILQPDDQNGRVTWSLDGPDPDSSSISGDVTGEILNGNSGIQTATLDTAGIYTLTITATVPDQGFQRGESASANLDQLTFSVISVPEPSSLMTLAVGLIAFIWRRK